MTKIALDRLILARDGGAPAASRPVPATAATEMTNAGDGSPLVAPQEGDPVEAPLIDDLAGLAPLASAPVGGADPTPLVRDRDDIGRLLDGNRLGEQSATVDDTILLARCEDLARRILRDGGHTSHAQLAREMGSTPATIKRLMATPMYREVWERAAEEVYGTIDDRLKDEKLDSLVRADTMQRRALTLLGETMELTRKYVGDAAAGRAPLRPQMLNAAIDLAAEVRQVVTARSATTGSNGATVNITVNKSQALVIQGAIRESGVDLSDVLDGLVVPTSGGQ